MLKATCSKRLPPHYFDPFSPLICSRCLESPINYQNYLAGFRPRTTRSFCFGKRTQNHFRPCAASSRSLRHRTESRWLGNSLRSNSPRREVDSVRRLCRARRREKMSLTLLPSLACAFQLHRAINWNIPHNPRHHFDTFSACPLG